MPIRTILTLVVAALLGLAAVLLTRAYLGRQQATDVQAAADLNTATVVVAAQPIARGVALTPGVLKVAQYPRQYVPVGAFRTVKEATSGGVRRALRPIAANEPILPDRITGAGGRASLSTVMTPGMRAITFRSNDIAGVAGFVLPGDRVDVLLTRSIPAGDGQETTITQVVATNIKVLGVDQEINESLEKPTVAKAITLEVTPDQAQTLPLAQSLGSVVLALRHISDELPGGRLITTSADLGGYRPRVSPPPPAALGAAPQGRPGRTVRVTRGTETSSYSVGM
jgi:pilus assembly protein CpaB